jgi:thioredoxin-related protein
MNITKYILAAAISISFGHTSSAQTEIVKKVPSKIEWISFEKAVFLNDMKPKKIFIDVYTDWCGWCKRMDAGTFKDSLISNYISENYYAVKLDAETKDTIRFRDKVFVFKPEMKSNELAISLLNGKMGYPSFVMMDEKYSILQPLSGYQTTEELLPVLKFYGSNAYLTTKWEDYSKK